MAVVQAMPFCAARRVAEFLGTLAFWLDRRHRRVAVTNLRSAYGDALSPAEAQALARRAFQHFALVAVEVAFFPRLMRTSTFRNHVRFRNMEVEQAVRRNGRGVIFVTAHLGNWEVGGVAMSYLGHQTHSVYRPLANPLLDRILMRSRRMSAQQVVPRKGALGKLLRVLRRRGDVAFLVDQHERATGIWVHFFGRPASTTPAPALLALRTNAPIITGYTRRVEGDFQFETFLDQPLELNPTGNRDRDVQRITQAINDRIESYVRRFPDQWLWLHRRWRTPPWEKGQAPHAT